MLARLLRSTPARAAAARAAGVVRSGATKRSGVIVRSTAAYLLASRASASAVEAAVAVFALSRSAVALRRDSSVGENHVNALQSSPLKMRGYPTTMTRAFGALARIEE